uniref:GTP-binding protein Rheb n=1 Tax=Cyprinus carpio carpio TaxID=630221 RepID=A0A9J8B1Q8_CYPCA
MPQPKYRKIAVLGYRSVGKSSLTIQFVEGQFVDSYDPTIENTFNKMVSVNGQDFNLQLVDTAGQDEYSIFPQSHSMDIHGYVLVYSVTSMKSFEVVQVLHDKLLDMVGKIQVPTVLVGNKKDLHMERVIKPEEGKKLADSWGAAFMESSAKENQVTLFFLFIIEELLLTLQLFTKHVIYLSAIHIFLFCIVWTFVYMFFICKRTFILQTAVEVFKRIILEMEKVDGNAPSEEKKCAVM